MPLLIWEFTTKSKSVSKGEFLFYQYLWVTGTCAFSFPSLTCRAEALAASQCSHPHQQSVSAKPSVAALDAVKTEKRELAEV